MGTKVQKFLNKVYCELPCLEKANLVFNMRLNIEEVDDWSLISNKSTFISIILGKYTSCQNLKKWKLLSHSTTMAGNLRYNQQFFVFLLFLANKCGLFCCYS